MNDYLKWYLCHRWLIKFAVKDWMTADANKLKQRKDYYYARMKENYCSIRTRIFIKKRPSVNSSIAREGKWLTYAKKRAAENARYVFTAYAMVILKLQFWHITGWLEFAELE